LAVFLELACLLLGDVGWVSPNDAFREAKKQRKEEMTVMVRGIEGIMGMSESKVRNGENVFL